MLFHTSSLPICLLGATVISLSAAQGKRSLAYRETSFIKLMIVSMASPWPLCSMAFT